MSPTGICRTNVRKSFVDVATVKRLSGIQELNQASNCTDFNPIRCVPYWTAVSLPRFHARPTPLLIVSRYDWACLRLVTSHGCFMQRKIEKNSAEEWRYYIFRNHSQCKI